MSVSDASMTSEWHAHDAHAFMMRARHVRVVIAHMMRGVTSRAGGAARRGAARRDATRTTRTVGCTRVRDRMPLSDTRHARDHDARMIRARS